MSDAAFPYCTTRASVQNFRNGRQARFAFYRGFTLIELLVVIAIISTMAAILLPVFAEAKSRAKQNNCLSNLKQLAVAWQVYADDYAGRACLAYSYPDFSHEYGWDFNLDYSQDPPLSSLGRLNKYTRSGKISSCPSFYGNSWGRPYTGYAYNTTYIGGNGNPPCQIGEIARPSKTVVFADGGYGNPVNSEAYLRAPSDSNFSAGKVHFRHNGWANVAYADCHVASTKKIYLCSIDEPNCGALSEDDSAYDLK